MKIIRYFIQNTSEETGLTGFLPLWIPSSANFDPSAAAGMVHDMFEHSLSDTGKLHQEAMAFGRLTALRVLPHVLPPSYAGTQEDGLGAEFAGIMASSNDCMIDAPKTAPIECNAAERALRKIMKACMRSYYQELQSNMDDDQDVEDNRPKRVDGARLLSWLRIGYRDALRRYGQQDHGCFDVGHAAFNWGKRNSARLTHLAESGVDGDLPEGFVLRLCFDTESLEMTDKVILPKDNGDFPQWLHQRVRKWNYS